MGGILLRVEYLHATSHVIFIVPWSIGLMNYTIHLKLNFTGMLKISLFHYILYDPHGKLSYCPLGPTAGR